MSEPSTPDKAVEDAFKKFDPALGAFVRQFEWLMGVMRLFIAQCFRNNGLKRNRLIYMVLAFLNQQPLRNLVAPIYKKACPKDPKGLVELEEILKKVDTFIAARNHFLHNFYYEEEERPGVILTMKHTKKGEIDRARQGEKDLKNYWGYMYVVGKQLHKAVSNIKKEESIAEALRQGLDELPKTLPLYKEPAGILVAGQPIKTARRKLGESKGGAI